MTYPLYASGTKAQLAFKDGQLVYAELQNQSNDLIALLNRSGKLTDEQARLLRDRGAELTDKSLAMRLISAKYATQKEIVRSIQSHIMNVIFTLMTWEQGHFRFLDDYSVDEERILVPVNMHQVIIEGARRQNEIEAFNVVIPDLSARLAFPENPKQKFRGVKLSREEWRVVGFINNENTVEQIRVKLNMTEFDIKSIVYTLKQADLIEIKRPAVASLDSITSDVKPVQSASIVNKLIDRLRTIN